MKILPVEEIRAADAYTIQNEPIADIDLMERAARKLFGWMMKRVDNTHRIVIFAGLGNNGGDGLALARLLHNAEYNVAVYVLRYSEKTSDSFEENYNRLNEIAAESVFDLNNTDRFPNIDRNDVLVDAIFGSGLTRPVSGFTETIIENINMTKAVKIAIDIPSGLYTDTSSNESKSTILKADYTLTFQFPKYAFLIPENDQFVGKWEILDIELHPDFIQQVKVQNHFILNEDVAGWIKKRPKFSHKGTYGHALLIAGSYGKVGAAILAAHACLRSGVGLLHVHIPKVAYPIMQTALPEAMISIDRYDHYFSEVPNIEAYNAIGIGPGLGMENQSQMAFKLLIQQYRQPMVIDADALNILSENKTWLSFLAPDSILTPHPKEFERLAGQWKNDFEKIEKLRAFCQKFGIIVVLKGANTATCLRDGTCYFNSTGNPGMATAGSGDVLTGIITGLLAQHYAPAHAAILGTYLHGKAGDLAAKKQGENALIAGDIIKYLGKAFQKLGL
ncbi:MAG: NAD(P)H-hydrate dehydratase [Bacteroidales bacterium]|nr:NAD(P)H-hydrate dehydratase [Bacteroidales bacterium]